MTLHGSEFEGITDVAFGVTSAADVIVVSDTIISAVVPFGLAGTTVDMIVTNRWGNQNGPGVQFSVT